MEGLEKVASGVSSDDIPLISNFLEPKFGFSNDNSYLGGSLLINNQLLNPINNMKELVDQIKAEYEVYAKNAEAQVEKGNKAAGARARKAALNLMKLMKEFRKVSVEATK